MYEVFVSHEAEKYYKKQDKDTKRRLNKCIDNLSREPIEVVSLSFGWGVAFLLCLGMLIYLINVYLIRHFVNKNAPGV